MRKGLQAALGRGHPHQLEQLERPRPGGLPADALVLSHGLGDLVADRVERVEGGHRLLEHHRDQRAAQLHHGAVADCADVMLADAHRPFHDRAVLGMQPQQRPHHHRLARAGFADHAKNLAAVEVERDAVDRPHRRFPAHEPHPQVLHVDERLRGGLRRAGRSRLAHRVSLPVNGPPPWLAPGCGPTRPAPCDRRSCDRPAWR